MLGAVVAQIVALVFSEHDAIGAEQPGDQHLFLFGPSSRSICGDIAGFPRPDDRHEDGGGNGKDAARRGGGRSLHEDSGRVGVE